MASSSTSAPTTTASAGDAPAGDARTNGGDAPRPLVAQVLVPVSEENPCGTDATYDDGFQLVKRKIDALSSFSGRIDQEKALAGEDESFVQAEEDEGNGSFAVIAATSQRLLRETSKDLRLACYLALALGHERGPAGAADGLAALRALVETYWDEMYPPLRRMRAREGALTFLFRRLGKLLETTEPAAEDRAPLEVALGDLQALQTMLMERMEDQAPVTSSLKKQLEAALRRTPAPPPDPAEAADADAAVAAADSDAPVTAEGEASNGAPAAEQASAAPPAEAAAGGARQKARAPSCASTSGPADETPAEDLPPQQANQRVLQVATAQRRQDDTQAAPYRIARALRWDALRALPPHDAETRHTRIAPPSPQRCDYLRGLWEKGTHQRLVADAEDSFHQPPFHFWLDLQRLLAQSLGALGEPYEAAALAVRRECALLLERLPGLPELAFRDGTPFAQPATREWLETSARPALGRADDEGGAAGSQRDPLDEQFQEARRALGAGDLPEALRLMDAPAASTAPSQRQRFRQRLYRALLCLRAGRPAVARPTLEALSQEADRRDLADWNPALALEVWTSLYECLMALAAEHAAAQAAPSQQQGTVHRNGTPSHTDADFKARAARAFDRICEIDPEQALALQPAPAPDGTA